MKAIVTTAAIATAMISTTLPTMAGADPVYVQFNATSGLNLSGSFSYDLAQATNSTAVFDGLSQGMYTGLSPFVYTLDGVQSVANAYTIRVLDGHASDGSLQDAFIVTVSLGSRGSYGINLYGNGTTLSSTELPTNFAAQTGNFAYSYGGTNYSAPILARFVSGVPEPATWAMFILGFGMVGGVMRYSRKGTRVRFA